jgi:tripartite-type tricarboxylate transporter receptor subunit TctC
MLDAIYALVWFDVRQAMSTRGWYWVITLLTGLLTLAACPLALAQSYPTRAIRIVVPTPPGGSTDLATRLIAAPLSKALGQPIIVENRGGASGAIGADEVAKAQPDGYTLLMIIDQNTILPSLKRHLHHSMVTSFAPISMVGKGSLVLVAHPSIPVRTLAELVAYAKRNPGKLSYASPGTGTSPHLAGELLKQATGLRDITHIPFKGGGEAIGAVLGGQVPLAMLGMAPVLPSIQAGKLHALGVTGATRSPVLPDVPTMTESGYPTLVLTNWLGLVAPAGTPAAVIDRLHSELTKTLQLPAVKQGLARLALEPAASPTPNEFRHEIDRELQRWAAVVSAAGIQAE